MNNKMNTDTITLARSEYGMIQRCRCNAYYLSMGQIQIHLSQEQFSGLIELFNLASYQDRIEKKGFLRDPRC